MSSPPVDWLLEASELEKKLATLSLPSRRLAMVDALQELAQESARMACFFAGQAGDDEVDYLIVEEEMIKGMQRFQGTLLRALQWKEYGDVKQEPLSPWLGAASSPSPVSTPISTPVSTPAASRNASPVTDSEEQDHFALYAPDSPKSDAGYPTQAEIYASMAENLLDDLQSPLLGALQPPLVEKLPPLLLDDLSSALAVHQPFVRALAAEVRTTLRAEINSGSHVAAEAPATPRADRKRARSPGLTPVGHKKSCASRAEEA